MQEEEELCVVKEEVGGAAGVKTFVCFMVTLAAG